MPVDPSIALQVRPPQIESPVNMLANITQLRNAQQQNQLGQMRMDEYRRGVEEQNALRGIFAQGNEDLPNRLLKGGFYKEAESYQKNQREQMKEQLAMAKDKIGLIGQLAGSATDPASYQQALQTAQSLGIDVSSMPAQYDPNAVARIRNQALTASQQLEQKWKELGFEQDQAEFAYRQKNDAANRGVTLRGQNLVDARARENLAQGGKAPSGYRWKQDGSLEAIPGGPGDVAGAGGSPKLTEQQGNAYLFGSRAAESDKIIRNLENTVSPVQMGVKSGLAGVPLIGGALNAGANVLASPELQSMEQAQRDFINAVLRKESGAVISPQEFDNARKQYFPQPGDGQGVIAQKRKNRETAIKGLQVISGPAGARIDTGYMGAAPSGQPSKPSVLTPDEQAELANLRKKLGR